MAQNSWWDNDDTVAKKPPRSPRERQMDADTEQSGASTEKTREEAITERVMRDPKLRKAIADADKAEALAREAGKDRRSPEEVRLEGKKKLDDVADLLYNVNLARRLLSSPTSTGPAGQVLQNLWGSDASSLDSTLSAISSPIVMEAMQEARKGSKVGATGFGALQIKELELLKDSIASLKQSQDPKILMDNLARVETHFRRFMAYNNGLDPDTPEGRYYAGIGDLDRPPSVDPRGRITGEKKWIDEPELRGMNATVNEMIKAGRTTEQIKSWLNEIQPGKGDSVDADVIQQNIDFWKAGGEPRINLEGHFETGTDLGSDIGDSPVGAWFGGAADVGTLGTVDELSGNRALTNAKQKGLEKEHPKSYLGGQLSGGALPAIGADAMAVKYGLPRIMPMFMDAVQGGGYAAGSAEPGDRVGAGAFGAVTSPLFGAGMRAAPRMIGAMTKGVSDPAVRLLREKYKIPLTIGQMARGGMKTAEDRIMSVPFVGDAIRKRREEGLEAFQKRAFDEGVETIPGADMRGEYGQAGVARSQQIVSDAYRDALDGVNLTVDPSVIAAIDNGPKAALAQAPGIGGELADRVDDILMQNIDNAGNMTGEAFQTARQQFRDLKASYMNDATSKRFYNDKVRPYIEDIEDHLENVFAQQEPANFAKYLQADEGYKRTSILGDAVDMRGSNEEMFSPRGLRISSRIAATKFGGKNASRRGDRPFNALAMAGQKVLPSSVPDSGTAGRLMLPLFLGGAAGGGSYFSSGEYNKETKETEGRDAGSAALMAGLTTLAAAAPYSRGGQRLATKMLTGDRSAGARWLGEAMQRYAGIPNRALLPQVSGSFVDRVPNPPVEEPLDGAVERAGRPPRGRAVPVPRPTPTASGSPPSLVPLGDGTFYDATTSEIILPDGERVPFTDDLEGFNRGGRVKAHRPGCGCNVCS